MANFVMEDPWEYPTYCVPVECSKSCFNVLINKPFDKTPPDGRFGILVKLALKRSYNVSGTVYYII